MRTIIESPYGNKDETIVERNKDYLKRCLKDSLTKGEAPFASHAIYTQVLDDRMPDERKSGIHAGLVWAEVAELVAVYIDYGITDGMREGIKKAMKRGIYVVYREIGKNPKHVLLNPKGKKLFFHMIGLECLDETGLCDCLYCQNRKYERVNYTLKGD